MNADTVYQVVNLFFGKRFGKELQLRFCYWFRMEGDEVEKEKAMVDLWESSPSQIVTQTWDDLALLNERIASTNVLAVKYSIFHKWTTYAAAVTLAVVVSLTTFWMQKSFSSASEVAMVDFFVPYGECKQVQLPDGSAVWVNAGSILIYPSEFTGRTRTIYLSGEAHFSVMKKPEQPFIVKTDQFEVEALGTVFNIQAYPNEMRTIATLEEGSIGVDVKTGNIPCIILKPNEQLIYLHTTREIATYIVDTEQMSSWKDGCLTLEDATFEQVVLALKRKYNVEINYDGEKYKGHSYYVKFKPDESLGDALWILSQLIDDLEYKINNSTVIIN